MIVAIVVAAVVVAYVSIAYVFSMFSSPEERCKTHCAELDRMSRMVPQYPNAENARRGIGPLRCECY